MGDIETRRSVMRGKHSSPQGAQTSFEGSSRGVER